jgi:hypothetical protein
MKTSGNPEFSPNQQLSQDAGGSFGGGSLTNFSLGNQVREYLTSSLDERKAEMFPPEKDIDTAIRLFVSPEAVVKADIIEIGGIIDGAIKAVRRNAKECGEQIPGARQALAHACRAVTSGLLQATHIVGEPDATNLEKLRHLCREDESILSRIATFTPPIQEVPAPVLASTAAEASQSTTEQPRQSHALSTLVDRLATLGSPDPSTQAETSARITALVSAGKVSEAQLGEFSYIASGTGRVDSNGALIINTQAPLYTSLNQILILLEADFPPEIIMLTVQLKRLLESTSIEIPNFIDEDRIQHMSEAAVARYFVRKLNLSLEGVEAFCDEFNFDIKQIVGSGEVDFDLSSATEDLEEIAEGIIFAMQNCSGATIDQRLEALIDLSREHPELGGNLERIRALFD